MEFKNDLGKPWKYQDGEYTVIRSSMWSPPGCHPTGCSVKLYVNGDGVLERVEGDENNPVTNGRLCPRCLALKDYIYNPSRVITPMKRAREDRGKADAWEPISWDEAFEIFKEKVDEIKEKYGPESIVVFCGTGRDGGVMGQDFAQGLLGTPNACYTQSGFACYQPRSCATTCVLGAYYPEIDYAGGLPGGYDDPAYRVPETIVLWGKEPLPSNGDGLFGHAVLDLMQRGAKLITLDPRVNWLSTRSAIHLRLRPGTDTAMAMAWLNIIISEDLYDHDFVERWTYGFEELAERVRTMTPERAAEICEVPVEDIYAAARMYANSKPASIAWGLALDQNQNGNQGGHCILALMAITGNVDVPGGQIIAEVPAVDMTLFEGKRVGGRDINFLANKEEDNQEAIPAFGWDGLSDELKGKIVGGDKYPLYVQNIRQAHADMMFDAFQTGEPYPIKMAWIQSSNLLAPTNCAEPDRWYEALKDVEFCMGTDLFMTPSIEGCADLFMPLSTAAEHNSVNKTHYGGSQVTYGAVNKAIDLGCKSDHELIVELGHYIGNAAIARRYDTGEEFVEDRRLKGEMKLSDLQEEVVHKRGVKYRKYETGELRPDRQPGFLTQTGRVELYSITFGAYGEDPLPFYAEPAFSPHSTPELAEKYPFILTTGARTYAFFHSEHRQVPYLRELNPNPLLEMNEADAREKGIVDGQWVEISNQFGSAKFKAKLTPTVKRGTVHAQHGWWFPEQDGDAPNLYGVFQSNVNTLIPNHYNSKLGYGGPYKCIICDVNPLDENLDVDMQEIWEKFGKQV